MNPLRSRKQLLVEQSELYRGYLVGDLDELKAGVRGFADRAKSFATIASSVAFVAAGVAALRGRKAAGDAKFSWWRTIRKGAGLISSVW